MKELDKKDLELLDNLQKRRQEKLKKMNDEAFFMTEKQDEKKNAPVNVEENKEKNTEEDITKSNNSSSDDFEIYELKDIYGNFEAEKNIVASTYKLSYAIDYTGQVCDNFFKQFLGAQKDNNANSADNTLTEGPKDYVKIMTSIRKLKNDINSSKSNNMTVEEFTKQFDYIMKSVNQYIIDHTPRFRSHKSPESAKRYEIMKSFMETGRTIANSIIGYSKEISRNINKSNIVNFHTKDLKISDLTKESLGIKALSDAFSEMKVDTKSLYDNIKENGADSFNENKQKVVNQIVLDHIKAITNNSRLQIDAYYNAHVNDIGVERYGGVAIYPTLKTERWSDLSVKETAQAYLATKYVAMANDAPEDETERFEHFQDMATKTRKENLTKELDNLVNNPAFKLNVSIDSKNAYSTWSDIVKKTDSNLDTSRKKLDDFKKGKVAGAVIDKGTIYNVLVSMVFSDPKYRSIQESILVSSMYSKDSCISKLCNKNMQTALVKEIKNNKTILKFDSKSTADLPKMIETFKKAGLVDKMASIVNKTVNKTINDNLEHLKQYSAEYNKNIKTPLVILNEKKVDITKYIKEHKENRTALLSSIKEINDKFDKDMLEDEDYSQYFNKRILKEFNKVARDEEVIGITEYMSKDAWNAYTTGKDIDNFEWAKKLDEVTNNKFGEEAATNYKQLMSINSIRRRNKVRQRREELENKLLKEEDEILTKYTNNIKEIDEGIKSFKESEKQKKVDFKNKPENKTTMNK